MTLQPWKYSKVTLDRSLKTAGMVGRQRPDVVGVARFGKSKLVEVVSKSQTYASMDKKCLYMMKINPGTRRKVISWAAWISRKARHFTR